MQKAGQEYWKPRRITEENSSYFRGELCSMENSHFCCETNQKVYIYWLFILKVLVSADIFFLSHFKNGLHKFKEGEITNKRTQKLVRSVLVVNLVFAIFSQSACIIYRRFCLRGSSLSTCMFHTAAQLSFSLFTWFHKASTGAARWCR